MKRRAELNDPDCGAIFCNHVIGGHKVILQVARTGPDWQFLCGSVHLDQDAMNVIHAHHAEEIDPTFEFSDLPEIPVNHFAEREHQNGPWKVARIPPDELELRDKIYEFFYKLGWR